MRRELAKYNEAILPEHRGNPYIEALRPKQSDDEILESLCFYPPFDQTECQLPVLERVEYLTRLEHLRQPSPAFIKCFRAIERVIKEGYSAKNPFSPTTMNFLHFNVGNRPAIAPKTGFFKPKGKGLTLIGDSGVGKTSMLEQILGYYPNLIIHDNYCGKPVEFKKQVVWIKVDCPHDSSVRQLCESILIQIDISVDEAITRPAGTIGGLIKQIEQKIKTCFLGILIIDEMQNLKPKKTGGEDNLLKFLHNMVNNIGVPILFCANPPFDNTLSKTLKAARRAESAGFFRIESPEFESEEWQNFVEELWEMQWTNVFTNLSLELNKKLFQLSTGNLDMACRTYQETQRYLMDNHPGFELITEAALEKGYDIACGLSSKTDDVYAKKAHISMPKSKRRQIAGSRLAHNESKKTKVFKSVPGDIHRPQHQEFADKLLSLLTTNDWTEQIHEPELMRKIFEEENSPKLKRIIMEDPLSDLI